MRPDGDRDAASRNRRAWSSHWVTSHLTNSVLHQESGTTPLDGALGVVAHPLSSEASFFPFSSFKSPKQTCALTLWLGSNPCRPDVDLNTKHTWHSQGHVHRLRPVHWPLRLVSYPFCIHEIARLASSHYSGLSSKLARIEIDITIDRLICG